MNGGKLAGGNPKNGRVENDFYATNPEAVKMLLTQYAFHGTEMLEPCVGQGHIAQAVQTFPGYGNVNVTGIDIVDRGYPNTFVSDFLTYPHERDYDFIISNPPYAKAQEFIEHCFDFVKNGGQIAMFLKIQFLEGAKRKSFYEKFPPKYIYVFRNRMPIWNNGSEVDPETGKRWATTMCHAWFIWEKGYTGEPVVRWS